jgi:hypothetical protein
MSANGIAGIDSSIYQYLQSLNAQAQSANATTTTGTTTQAATPTTPVSLATQPVQSQRHHRHGGGALFKQIEAAVTSALQSAKSSGSTADPNTIIQNAIAGVLQKNGVTNTNSATGQTAAATRAVGQAGSNQQSVQAFLQLLQANGINAQQFQADFLAAVKNAQNGKVNPATALQALPPGTGVNTTG